VELKCEDELRLGRDTPDHHVESSDEWSDDDRDDEAEEERRDAGWTVASR
jgi:hypothetical protein